MRAPRAGGPYIQPIKSDGTLAVEATGRGKYTLTSGTTYYAIIGGPDAFTLSAHVQWDASIIITSVTVEDCNFGMSDASDYSSTAGDWIDEDPTTAFVGLVGAGASHTNGVVAVTGGAAGGAMLHVADTGSIRTRLKIVVGGTGGVIRIAASGKG